MTLIILIIIKALLWTDSQDLWYENTRENSAIRIFEDDRYLSYRIYIRTGPDSIAVQKRHRPTGQKKSFIDSLTMVGFQPLKELESVSDGQVEIHLGSFEFLTTDTFGVQKQIDTINIVSFSIHLRSSSRGIDKKIEFRNKYTLLSKREFLEKASLEEANRILAIGATKIFQLQIDSQLYSDSKKTVRPGVFFWPYSYYYF